MEVIRAGRLMRIAPDLVAQERASFEAWKTFDDPKRQAIMACVREQLLALLTAPEWVAGALNVGPGDQIHVRFVIQPDDLDSAYNRFLDADYEGMRARLIALAEHLCDPHRTP